jgi:hypothetical protein
MNQPIKYQFSFEELEISKECIEYTMGFPPGATPAPFNEIIDEVLREIPDNCDIRGAVKTIHNISPDPENNKITVDHRVLQTGSRITSLLAQAESLALFIVTAGKGIQEWIHQCKERQDIEKAYVIDVVGSEIVDLAGIQIMNNTEKKLQQNGLAISDMFSPGYCDWPVDDQEALFSFFPTNCCGIKLTESLLMDPIKSISGIMGVGKNIKRYGENYCAHCQKTDCIYRYRRHQHQ